MVRGRLNLPTFLFFILPSVIIVIVLTIFPIAYSVQISLTDWDIHKLSGDFVGLENYVDILFDRGFQRSMLVTLEYGIAALSLQIPLGFGLAILLNREIRGKRIFITTSLIPLVLAGAVTGLVMRWMFNYNYGMVNYFLGLLGIEKIPWLENATTALWAVILVDVWQTTPISTLIFYAGLRSLPKGPTEAALVDGASQLQIIRHITIPMMRPLIIFVLIIRTMDCLRIFDQVSVMTAGGPGTATDTISYHIYRVAFRYMSFSQAASIAIIFLLVLSAFIISYMLLLYRKEIGEL